MKKISFAIPLFNESECFDEMAAAVTGMLEHFSGKYDLEAVLVDDGSRDDTWKKIVAFAEKDTRIKGICLSRNFGHQSALHCAYKYSSGDAIISMDGDMQDPPEVVYELVKKWEEGSDIVFAIRRKRYGESAFKLWTAHVFYRLIGAISHTTAPLDCGDFRLMSSKALKAMLQMGDYHLYLRGMVGWIGFKTASVEYDRPPRAAGTTKYGLLKMMRLAIYGLVSFSDFPLRLCIIVNLIATIPLFLYLAYSLILYFLGIGTLTPGWTSLLVGIIAFGSFNLFSTAMLSEYVGKIFDVVRNRPLHIEQDFMNFNDRDK